VGIQAVIWSLSGLYMTAIHIDYIHGDHLVKSQKSIDLSTFDIQPLDKKFLGTIGKIKSIQLKAFRQQPAYFIRTDETLLKIHGVTLKLLPELNESDITEIANDIYAGSHKILKVELLERYPDELGGHKKPIWLVEYDDWLQSSLYFLPETGQLRSKRSNLWRIFDFLWMLHIMDYESREDVNNNLLTLASLLGVFFVLSGLGLLYCRFRKSAGDKQ